MHWIRAPTQPELKSAEVAPPVIGEEGTLRVGVNTENPPLAGMGSGKIIGIDVDIAAALADELGLKLSVVDVGSDPAGALANGTVDVVLGIDDSASDGDFWRVGLLPAHGHRPVRAEPRRGHSHPGFRCHLRRPSFLEERLGRLQRVRRVQPHAHRQPEGAPSRRLRPEACSTWPPTLSSACTRPMARGSTCPSSPCSCRRPAYCMGVSNENVDLQTAAGDVLARLVSDGTINVIERKWLGTTVALGDLTVVSDLTASAADAATGSDNEDAGDSDSGDADTGDSGDTGSEDTGSGDSSDGSDESGDTGSGDDSGSEDSGDAGDSGSSGDEDAAE